MFVADAHTHVFRQPTHIYRRPILFTADDLIGYMDRFGVDLSIVIARPTAPVTVDELRREHDLLAEDVARFQDRLAAYCWLAPRLGESGVAEVERCLSQLGYVGIKLH